MQDKIIEVLKIVISVMIVTAIFFPFVKWIANHIGALDYPGERKVHKKPMPLLGGLMMFFGFLFGYMVFAPQSTQMLSILIGSFILVITGIIDDVKPLKAKEAIIGQLIAAAIVVFYGNILLNDITIFGLYIHFGVFAYPLTILFLVAVMNCVNLIDGLDGLASGISTIFFATIGIIAFIMLGASLGFLIFNFNPSKIFMGEVGSMFLGYMIGIVCLLGFKGVTVTSLLVPLLIFAIPILDTFFAIVRRIVNRKPIYEADKEHIHHQLLNMKFSQKKTVLIIYAVNILFSMASIFYVLKDKKAGIIIYTILLVLLIIFVIKTNIITGTNNSKKKNKKHGK